jgi:hypothetical protein
MKPETTKKLEELFDTDQENIKLFRDGKISTDELIKRQNDGAETIKEVISEEGFPFIKNSSEKAYNAAFLMIQHSSDMELMMSTIDMFRDNEDSIIKPHLAYLIDRVRVIEEKPQLYGTQYKNINGEIEFFEIEDLDNIEQRRKEMEMESFEDYKKKIK